MDRATYIKNCLSKYFEIAREEEFPLSKYEKDVMDLICKEVPLDEKILEVGIGTGDPLADYLCKVGHRVYGIDVSPKLIKKCKKVNDKIICKISSAEDIKYLDYYFQCVYCLNSTWYFLDLQKAISEMIRVTKYNGIILFDIQNRNNKKICDGYLKGLKRTKLSSQIFIQIKNILRLMLKWRKPGYSVWFVPVYEIPSYPKDICDYLNSIPNITYEIYGTSDFKSMEYLADHQDSLSEYPRLLFQIMKKVDPAF